MSTKDYKETQNYNQERQKNLKEAQSDYQEMQNVCCKLEITAFIKLL